MISSNSSALAGGRGSSQKAEQHGRRSMSIEFVHYDHHGIVPQTRLALIEEAEQRALEDPPTKVYTVGDLALELFFLTKLTGDAIIEDSAT
jgi:hypothetical protein